MFEDSVRNWILGWLSESTAKRNNLPRCPFAKPALEKGTVFFETVTNEQEFFNLAETHINTRWSPYTKQAVVIHLDWEISNKERIQLQHEAVFRYHHTERMFIEEYRVLDGVGYHFILIHCYNEMQDAKKLLENQGYYNH